MTDFSDERIRIVKISSRKDFIEGFLLSRALPWPYFAPTTVDIACKDHGGHPAGEINLYRYRMEILQQKCWDIRSIRSVFIAQCRCPFKRDLMYVDLKISQS